MRAPFSGLTLATLAGLAACGGGTGPSTPPPPPPGSSAASLTVAAGDGQAALPGTAVSVKPSVRVRDAQGNAVSGATVAFVVEAGGGSVQQASVKSGADGLASPGDWTLGAGEGENRLRASTGSLPPVVLTAQGRYPAVTLADTTLGAGGGTIVYRKAGDPLDGLELRVPAGAYPTPSRWTITARPSQAAPPLRFGQQVGSVLEIVSDQAGYADSLLELQIPHPRTPGEFAMAFGWNRATGRLEALPLAGETATKLIAVSRHFNPALLVGPTASAAPVANPGAGLNVGGLYVLIAKTGYPLLEQPISSGFLPGVDDWEFPNYGSYMEPGGHCSGQSASAIWYYLNQKVSRGPLYESLGTLAQFWPDNPQGYRFASWVQANIDWYKVSQSERQMAAIAQRSGVPADRLYFYALAFALRVTGEPQFVGVSEIDPNGRFLGGHAMVGYATERTKIWVADPNFPGQTRGIVYLNDRLGPYTSKPNAGAGDIQYNLVSFQSLGFIVPLSQVAAGWAQVQQGTIGDGWFPDYQLEYQDSVANLWRPLGDTLTVYQGGLQVRTLCGSCWRMLVGGGVSSLQPTWLVDAAGTDIGSGLAVTVPLPGGSTRFGGVIYGLPAASVSPGANGEYIDFRWITVKSLRFTLTPAHSTAPPNANISFVSHPIGGAPSGAHYVWDFGDQSAPLDKLNDSTATHKYTANGFYTVKVSLKNSAGRLFAEARATVLIGIPVVISPNPGNTSVNTQLTLTARSQAPGTPSPLRYWWDFGDGQTLQVVGDSSARHSWTTPGDYTVTVLLEDPVTAADLGRATGQVVVADTTNAPVWRITWLRLDAVTGDVPHDSLARYPNLVAYGTYFRHKQVLSDISNGLRTADIHALGGAVTLPDCFDFDFDGNKAELITWPAWIWLQFPNELPGAACGGDKVLGHWPFAPSWDLGWDQSAFFRQFQNADIRFDYPDPLFASVSLGTGTGSLSGRGLAEWVCCGPLPGVPGASLAEVHAVYEITATIAGRTLSGRITLIYILPSATWRAVYSFDAEQGR